MRNPTRAVTLQHRHLTVRDSVARSPDYRTSRRSDSGELFPLAYDERPGAQVIASAAATATAADPLPRATARHRHLPPAALRGGGLAPRFGRAPGSAASAPVLLLLLAEGVLVQR
jgi:hypothetical protein